jgi:hypothetical protein
MRIAMLRLIALAAVVDCGVGPAAANTAIALPPETARLKPSELPGYQIAVQKCGICHSADYISLQPPAMGIAQWTVEALKMQRTYGAPISDDEIKLLGEYLGTVY